MSRGLFSDVQQEATVCGKTKLLIRLRLHRTGHLDLLHHGSGAEAPAVEGAHPMQITLGRCLVGGICLPPRGRVGPVPEETKLTGKDLRSFCPDGGFFGAPGHGPLPAGPHHGHANVVAVIFSGNPIFVTLLAF